MLPSLNTWYRDLESDINDDESVYKEAYDDVTELQALVDGEEHGLNPCNREQEEQLLVLTYASLAVTADELSKV